MNHFLVQSLTLHAYTSIVDKVLDELEVEIVEIWNGLEDREEVKEDLQ